MKWGNFSGGAYFAFGSEESSLKSLLISRRSNLSADDGLDHIALRRQHHDISVLADGQRSLAIIHAQHACWIDSGKAHRLAQAKTGNLHDVAYGTVHGKNAARQAS